MRNHIRWFCSWRAAGWVAIVDYKVVAWPIWGTPYELFGVFRLRCLAFTLAQMSKLDYVGERDGR